MVNKLSLDDREDTSFVSSVARSLFADGTTNWGRIVSLVAFGAVVSQYLKEKGRGHCVEQVGQEISTYLLTEQRDWLIKNNSWVSCYDSCLNDRMFGGKKKMNWLHNCPHCAIEAYVSSAHTPLPLCCILRSPSNQFSYYCLFSGWLCRVLQSSRPRIHSEEHSHGSCWICWHWSNTCPVDQVNLLDIKRLYFKLRSWT